MKTSVRTALRSSVVDAQCIRVRSNCAQRGVSRKLEPGRVRQPCRVCTRRCTKAAVVEVRIVVTVGIVVIGIVITVAVGIVAATPSVAVVSKVVIVTSPDDGAGAKAVEAATVVNDDGIGDVAFDRWPARAPRETMEFTESKLKDLLKGGRPQRQSVIWDTKATGLSVLISRGPKEKRQATLSLRVVYI